MVVKKKWHRKLVKIFKKNWYCTIIQRSNDKCLLGHNNEASNSFYIPDRIFFEVIFPKYVNE